MNICAHGCGTDRYPVLTLQAALHSLSLGASCVEMDIRFTGDRVAVIAHDEDAFSLFGVHKNIQDMTAREFTSLPHRANPDYHPCTLEDMLNARVSPILFHVKEGGDNLKRLLEILAGHDYLKHSTMGVTSTGDVGLVKEYDPALPVLAFMPNPESTMDFIHAGADIIRYWEPWVNPESVALVHSHGRKFWIMVRDTIHGRGTGYTDPANYALWAEMGVDGLLINEIHSAKAFL